jgi:hypothetical protein
MAADKEIGSTTTQPEGAKEVATEEAEKIMMHPLHTEESFNTSGTDNRECSSERENLDSLRANSEQVPFEGDVSSNETETDESEAQPPAGFDMRSIHEHPPSPSNEQKEQEQVDPAWDTSKNAFEEANDNPALTMTMNFDTVILESGVFSPNEEKKEREVMEANTGIPQPDDWETCGPAFVVVVEENEENDVAAPNTSSIEIMDTTFSHLSLSGLADDEGDAAEEPSQSDIMERAVNEDEPLLRRSSPSHVVADTDIEEPALSMEQRIDMYTTTARDDDSSTDDDSEAVHSDEESLQEEVEIAYVDQNSDNEDEGEFSDRAEDDGDLPQESSLRNEAPTFEVAADAAANAESEVSRNDSKEINSSHAPSPIQNQDETTDSKKEQGAKKIIPLIAPPPEEKFKKWEEQKLRGQRHLAALKASRETSGKNANEQWEAFDAVSEPPDVTGSHSGDKDEVSRAFSSPEKTKQSGENNLSPTSSGSILTDQKMAEKIALASSAAAVTFEEQYQQADTIAESSNTKLETTDGSFMPSNDMLCGAFASWEEPSESKRGSKLAKRIQSESQISTPPALSQKELKEWFLQHVLTVTDPSIVESQEDTSMIVRRLLDDNANFNLMCQYIADCVNRVTSELGMASSMDVSSVEELTGKSLTGRLGENIDSMVDKKRPWLKPMTLSDTTWNATSATVVAANFVNFLFLASKLTKVPSPFGDRNPFIDDLVTNSLAETEMGNGRVENLSPQYMIFEHPRGKVDDIIEFVYKVSVASESQREANAVQKLKKSLRSSDLNLPPKSKVEPGTPSTRNKSGRKSRRLIVPEGHPSPFEASVWNCPRIIAAFLSFLGDPVAVSRMKRVNRFCCRIVTENEHVIMQDAVRTGGLSMNVRPAFWIWITLEKFPEGGTSAVGSLDEKNQRQSSGDMKHLADQGRDGKWQHVIERDVARSFGNMPPHKTIAKLQDDSIVRALVTWGQNRIMKRGVRGGGEPVPTPQLGPKEQRRDKGKPPRNSSGGKMSSPPWICSGNVDLDDNEQLRIDTTVSDWSGVSPVPSFTGSYAESLERTNSRQFSDTGQMLPLDELALGGNCLTNDVKVDLQNKLRFILHSLAAVHEHVGYCQGMDYVVAHLLRILQDTVMWKASKGTLPAVIATAPPLPEASNLEFQDHQRMYEEVDNSLVVEEVVFRVMDTFFTTYNLRHMYWPELRCLKTFCRVFERLIQIKLPVLADHFEHHDLNVGLFALGWFQTLFLYLPSMPSATVCHMWDIWLVERSFKIFFRVGTAILFLSQPTLLNNELEGMMTYLNTFPDATLLKPDILIPCALNIKVTNRMLQELETEVTAGL